MRAFGQQPRRPADSNPPERLLPGPRLECGRGAVRRDSGHDATTRLANERTSLAWWQTELTALAVSFGLGQLLAGIGNGTGWPCEAIGSGFGVLGVVLVAYAYVRRRVVQAALRSGHVAAFDPRVALAFAVAGVVLRARRWCSSAPAEPGASLLPQRRSLDQLFSMHPHPWQRPSR
ncbi:MAG: YidH family protein [Gaiellaceae bacterium]